MGAALRSRAHRPADPSADLRLGGAVVAGAATGLLHPLLGVVSAGLVWCLPALRAAQAARRRRAAVVDGLADAVDLLALGIAAGLNVRLALEAVTRNTRGPVVDVLGEVLDRVGGGERLVDALDALDGLGDEGRPLRDALVASERYGVPISAGLERVALEVRDQRRRSAEADARRTPVRVLFPLVLCFLPAFGLLTVVPLVAGSLVALAP
ncbi:MAG: type II secretion system F family protein [Acidimicrobiales bacterium]|nr:type II secretion system F family protein [Acidimicrobiales bacterium]